jgi:hypothetical protein
VTSRTMLVSLWLLSLPGCWDGTASVGDPCEEKQECSSGLCLQESRYGEWTGWREGYCTRTCRTDCKEGGVCVAFADASYCLSVCESDGACRLGYLCHPGLGACLPDCREGFDCDGEVCGPDGFCAFPAWDTTSGSSGTATDGTQTDEGGNNGTDVGMDAEIGAPCLGSSQCLSGMCLPEQQTVGGIAWQGGMCTQSCTSSCPPDSVCALAGANWYCLPRCLSDAGCREGYVCDWSVDACVPDCRIGFPCPSGLMCSGRGVCGGKGGSGSG